MIWKIEKKENRREKETNNMAIEMMKRKGIIKMFLSFHSFGQYILTPWGFATGNPYPPDYQVRRDFFVAFVSAALDIRLGTITMNLVRRSLAKRRFLRQDSDVSLGRTERFVFRKTENVAKELSRRLFLHRP